MRVITNEIFGLDFLPYRQEKQMKTLKEGLSVCYTLDEGQSQPNCDQLCEKLSKRVG